MDAAIVLLGDMPAIDAAMVDRLIDAFDPSGGALIVVPTSGGKRGNPVLWSSRFFTDLAAVHGDTGGRHLIGANPDAVVDVIRGAFRTGMRDFTFNLDSNDFIRITGYLVRKSDLARIDHGARHDSTFLGAGSVAQSHVDHRAPKRVVAHELDAGPAR